MAVKFKGRPALHPHLKFWIISPSNNRRLASKKFTLPWFCTQSIFHTPRQLPHSLETSKLLSSFFKIWLFYHHHRSFARHHQFLMRKEEIFFHRSKNKEWNWIELFDYTSMVGALKHKSVLSSRMKFSSSSSSRSIRTFASKRQASKIHGGNV